MLLGASAIILLSYLEICFNYLIWCQTDNAAERELNEQQIYAELNVCERCKYLPLKFTNVIERKLKILDVSVHCVMATQLLTILIKLFKNL